MMNVRRTAHYLIALCALVWIALAIGCAPAKKTSVPLAWEPPVPAKGARKPPRITAFIYQNDDWFRTAAGRRVVDNIVGWQNPNGGWFKNYDPTKPRPAVIVDDPRSGPPGDDDSVWHRVSTFDNSATYTEMQVIARAYRVLKDERYRKAFDRGLQYIFESQYGNGGWPQRFPLQNNYGRYITFNDDAMTGVMVLLKSIVDQQRDFEFVRPEQRRWCKSAFDRGIKCVLDCQIRQNGVLTVWCQQHDEITLAPRGGRTFELPGLCGDESADVLRLLMSIDHPDARVRESIEAGAAWYRRSAIRGKRWQPVKNPAAPRGKDYVLIDDPTAPPLWARYYDLQTNRPFFASRDGIERFSVDQITVGRRAGYGWYGRWGDGLESSYQLWKSPGHPGSISQ